MDEHHLLAGQFEEHRAHLGRTLAATRQLASRARRRVRGALPSPGADQARRRALVDAFLAASREGDFAALLEVLDPDVVLRADAAAVRMGATAQVRGARAVADTFKGRARAAQPALIDSAPGLVWLVGGEPRVVFEFTIAAAKKDRGHRPDRRRRAHSRHRSGDSRRLTSTAARDVRRPLPRTSYVDED